MILLRKKLYTQATKNLERALKGWTGEPEELAQVHNALGYAFFNMDKVWPRVRWGGWCGVGMPAVPVPVLWLW